MDTTSSFTAGSAEPAPQAKAKAYKLFYIGKVQPFMQLAMANMLFTYLTLGGYYFKAITRILTYLGRNLAFTKQLRVKYDGQPLPLFKEVAPVIAVLVIAAAGLFWSMTAKSYPVFFSMVVVIYACIHAGLFLARRYHLRHIHLGETGLQLDLPLLTYMICVMKRAALNVISFGYAIPQSDIERWNLVANHLQIGPQKVTAQAKAKELRWIHLVSFYIPFLLAVVFMTMSAQAALPAAAGGEQNAVASSFMLVLFNVTLVGGFIGRVWYRAALRRECLRGIDIAGLRFKTNIVGKDLLRNRLLNIVVTIVTLGLGFPFMLHRNLESWCKTTIITGPLETLLRSQGKTA